MDIKWVELRKKIQEAELVLVGIGEECQYELERAFTGRAVSGN